MHGGVTLRQVAVKANVSIGTASRVLNGVEQVNPARALSVRNAVEALGYRKVAATAGEHGRGSLVRTGNIGLLLGGMSAAWLRHPLLSNYMQGVEQACRERGFHPLIEFSENEAPVPRFVTENKVDGVLVKLPGSLQGFCKNLPSGFPVVGLATSDPMADLAQVMPDNRAAGYTMAEYLWQKGHRRIAFLCNEMNHRMFIPRYQGYEEFLRRQRAFDLTFVEMFENAGDRQATPLLHYPNMAQAFDRLWNRPADHRPTAVIAANDWMAAGVLSAARERGVSVPHDLSLVGFDNFLTTCCTLQPELTSYEVPLTQVAYHATISLIDRIQGLTRTSSTISLIRGEIVERQSVAAPVATNCFNGR